MNRLSQDLPHDALVQRARLAVGGQVFVLSAPASVPLRQQAVVLYGAVAAAVDSLGGWLIDELVAGGEPQTFGTLMEAREAGGLEWDAVDPSAVEDSPGVHGRQQMKLPYNMLSRAGYPCWALQRKLYTLDLFNPNNELLLPYEETERRLWQIVPWLARFDTFHPVGPFLEIIKQAAVSVDAQLGFGGKGLPDAIFAARFASLDRTLNPLPPGTRLTDLSYPYMVLRKAELGDGLLRRLQTEDFPVEGMTKRFRIHTCEVFGPNQELVLLGIEKPPLSFPDAADLLGITVGDVIGRPYVWKVVSKER